MDLIQLMGSPSANRQALGNVGIEGSSETVNFELGSDFKAQLNSAIFDGQDKEVNPDGLIAQLVALDLNLGQLPIPQVGSEQELTFNLSLGQVKGDSVDVDGIEALDTLMTGFCGTVSKADQDVFRSGRSGNGLDLEKITQFVKSLPPGELRDSLESKLELLQSGALTRATTAYLTEMFQKYLHGANSGNGSGGVDLSGSDEASLTGTKSEKRCVLTYHGTDSTDSDSINSGQESRTDSDTDAATLSNSEYASVQKTKNEFAQLGPDGDFGSKGPGNVGYKGTGQGRPDDRDWVLPPRGNINGAKTPPTENTSGAELKPVVRPNLVIQEGKVVSSEVTSTFKTDQESLKASEVIESLAGRLTKESITLTPNKLAESGAKVIDSGTFTDADSVSEVAVASTEKVVAEQQALESAEEFGMELSKGSRNQIAGTLGTPVESENVLEALDDDETDVSVDSVNGMDDSREVSREFRSSEAKLTSSEKAIAEQAIRNARNEIVQSAIDLAAARRPQSIKIQLTPFELGTIDVSVRSTGGRVDVDLRASDDAVRQGLSAQRGELVQAIENRGTTVSSMNVGHHSGQQFGQTEGNGGQQASREDFQQAVTLGQFSTNADALTTGSPSYVTSGSGRVDLAA